MKGIGYILVPFAIMALTVNILTIKKNKDKGVRQFNCIASIANQDHQSIQIPLDARWCDDIDNFVSNATSIKTTYGRYNALPIKPKQ